MGRDLREALIVSSAGDARLDGPGSGMLRAREETLSLLIDPEIRERVRRIELRWNELGVDRYGVSVDHVARMFTALGFFYRRYFDVSVHGIENVPARGRAMLVGNHSGGVALDGAMVLASCFFEKEPPRLAQGMAEKFINRVPFASTWTSRTGQFTGVPETAWHLLEDERLLLVFPEGARGTAKLYKDRYSLVHFGSGFMRLALRTKTPIVPFAFAGGGEAIPTIANSYWLGRLVGAPYVPLTPWIFAVPRPARLGIEYGEPMRFEGTGNEEDAVVDRYVGEVKERIGSLLEVARGRREAA